MSNSLVHAELLCQQSKYPQAEKEIRDYLRTESEDGHAYSLLALVLMSLKKPKESLDSAQQGLRLNPNDAHSFYVMAVVYSLALYDNKKAEEYIKKAVQLEPESAEYFGTYAAIKIEQGKKREALVYAQRGLKLDPESATCKKIKALALTLSNKSAEADQLLDEVLAEDAEDALAISEKGRVALLRNDYKSALNFYKESLRLEPDSESAKEGLIVALKAHYIIYRLLFNVTVFLSKQSGRAKWALIIGVYVLMRILSKKAESNPGIAPFIYPILAVYLLFIVLSWTADPIFNTFLRFNKYGKYALSKSDILGSNLLAGTVLLAVVQALISLVTSGAYTLYGVVGTLFMIFPVSGTFNRYGGKGFKFLLGYTILLTLLLIAGIVATFISNDIARPFMLCQLMGVIIFSWVASFI